MGKRKVFRGLHALLSMKDNPLNEGTKDKLDKSGKIDLSFAN
jgi:hypothetical protein